MTKVVQTFKDPNPFLDKAIPLERLTKRWQLSKGVIHVLESINDAFVAIDHQAKIFYINNKAEKLLRTKLSFVKAKTLNAVHQMNPRCINPRRLFEKLATATAVNYEEYIDAAQIWVQIHAHLCEEGTFIYMTDVTHYKLTEHYLKRSEEYFKRLADTAPVLIWRTNTRKEYIYFNKYWLSFRGRTLEEELAKGLIMGIEPDKQLEVQEVLSSYMDAQIDFQLECRLRRSGGEYRWVLLSGTPLFTPQGTFEGYIGTGIDINDRKELEKRKDEFISIASHELKTPITSLKAFTQILSNQLRKENQTQTGQYLSRMHVQINKITMLIEELLDISKIEQKKLEFDKKEFDIKKLVEEVVEDVKATNPNYKIAIRGKVVSKVLGDTDRISQVLINLLNNAIKYSPDSERIIVSLEQNEGFIKVSVRDFGIGIAKNHLQHIFERFFRAPGLKKETFPGLGLGLYISTEIIKRHGGKITVSSKEGRGSIFSFYLPLNGWR